LGVAVLEWKVQTGKRKISEEYAMSMIKTVLLASVSLGLFGCVSQQSHEQTLADLEQNNRRSTEEIAQLHQVVKEKQEAVDQLQMEKKDLEDSIEVQDQIKDQQLDAVKNELELIYGHIAGLGQLPETGSPLWKTIAGGNPVHFEDVLQAFHQLQAMLQRQMQDFSNLRNQNGQLEQEVSAIEARLQGMERLKRELEQVRLAREVQEKQLAKVKREVQTVGEEIERITKALENKFGQSLVVTQHQDRLVLTLLGQVLFESGKADLTPLGLQIMKEVGQVLATLPEKYIQVEGHTDDNPIYGQLQQQYPTNWELSTARATTVLRYLIEQTKMSPQDFGATGYADTRPVTTNETEEGRAQNRRVEIVLYPKQALPVKDTVATIAQ
jgi:chemotaxis protein MotB